MLLTTCLFFAGKIVGSWFISPVLSGIMSTILFSCIRLFILNAEKPVNAALLSLPLIYGLTTFINVISIVMDGPKRNYFTLFRNFSYNFEKD